MIQNNWLAIGNSSELVKELTDLGGLKEILLLEKRIVLSYVSGKFGAVSARCNHMGGPLAKGKLKEGYIECPWHYWQFDHQSGKAKNTEANIHYTHCGGALPSYTLKIENNQLLIDMASETKRERPDYNREAEVLKVGRETKRAPGKLRVVGISTTAMDKNHPRYSTSEDLLKSTLMRGEAELNVETQFYSLAEMNFRHCEGFYSKSEKACTWPCSITKLDPQDEMVKIYEALVHWADVVVLATPIRWGSASSLYYKMAERLNSIQNHITTSNKVLIQNKVASFIITGGQDNVQHVAGELLNFFGELGFVTPPFPYVGHSLGWSSEDMEHNMDYVKNSEYLHEHSFELLKRSIDLSKKIIPLDL